MRLREWCRTRAPCVLCELCVRKDFSGSRSSCVRACARPVHSQVSPHRSVQRTVCGNACVDVCAHVWMCARSHLSELLDFESSSPDDAARLTLVHQHTDVSVEVQVLVLLVLKHTKKAPNLHNRFSTRWIRSRTSKI